MHLFKLEFECGKLPNVSAAMCMRQAQDRCVLGDHLSPTKENINVFSIGFVHQIIKTPTKFGKKHEITCNLASFSFVTETTKAHDFNRYFRNVQP